MNMFIALQNKLYGELQVQAAAVRRRELIDEMAQLSGLEIHCFNCTGTCCTYSANSMRITPIEAFEILISLEVTRENASNLREKLKKNIKDYRLDHEIFTGKKHSATYRKTYTCPFFVAGPKGCTIKKELKPYGCLGFNPRTESDNGSQCISNVQLLEVRENAKKLSEDLANSFLVKELSLGWEKQEIPKAILCLLDIFFPQS